MRKWFALLVFVVTSSMAIGQDYYTRNAQVSFFSSTPAEDIKAQNNEVVSFLDTKTGDLKFQLLIKGFVFPNARMQEHFNGARYMKSDEFPRSSFEGKIDNLKAVKFNKNGTYKVTVSGNLQMHGITKPVKATGTFTILNGKIAAASVFKIKRADFGISMVSEKVADELEITVSSQYEVFTR